MDRSDDPIILKGTGWLSDPSVQAVCSAIAAGGGAAYFVGGCVRDAVLGIAVQDVDMATDALPENVSDMAKVAGLKVVPTGIDHGTVTIISGGRAIEVTTFRRDVETDGRHAKVVFSRSMSEDARRRDFTLNALYADRHGRLYDPLRKGLADCLARRIRFINDADERIREDYLRILRFFRFHAWYAPHDAGFDADDLDAVCRNQSGLETLSAERVGAEMLRLFAAPDPTQAVSALAGTGALGRVLPAAHPQLLGPYVHLENQIDCPPDPIGRLAAIGDDTVPDSFRLSRKDTRMYRAIRSALTSGMPSEEIAFREGFSVACAAALGRAATTGSPLDPKLNERLHRASTEKFPVKASDLKPTFEGKALGDRIRLLERQWIASEFTLSREELMNLP
ncbi:MAG: CCA tRNA nucleotidyltransferase [Pseudomonadota bacterium]